MKEIRTTASDRCATLDEVHLAGIEEAHRQRLADARERYADWDEVANRPQAQRMMLPPAVELAIKKLENGPDLLYFLATHPVAFRKLESMTPPQRLDEIANISRKLGAQTDDVTILESAPLASPMSKIIGIFSRTAVHKQEGF